MNTPDIALLLECRFADNSDAAQVLFGFSDDIQGVAFVPNGLSILVADGTNDHTSIRRVMLADGATTTVAGGLSGYVDGVFGVNRFNKVGGIIVLPDGDTVIIADSKNLRIRKMFNPSP